MNSILQVSEILLGAIAGFIGIGWLGLKIKPSSFPPYPEPTQDCGTVELPDNMPPQMQRYCHAIYGERIPKIESAAIWGRAKFKLSGLRTFLRFKTYYRQGEFCRYMELTWFGIPIFKAADSYLDNCGKMAARGLVSFTETGEKISQGAILNLWAETLVLVPAMLVNDSNIQWEVVDENTVGAVISWGDRTETLWVKFDPQTHLISELSAMRYRGQEESKTPWKATGSNWQQFDSTKLLSPNVVRWEDEPTPYWIGKLDGVAYNVDISPKTLAEKVE